MTAKTRPLVLHYSPKGRNEVPLTQNQGGFDFEWSEIVSSDPELIAAQLRLGHVAVLVIDQQLDPQLELLTHAVLLSPGTIRILYSEHCDLHILRLAINRGRIYRVAQSVGDLPDLVASGLREYHREIRRVELVRESARQNRELEELTLNLESRVEERTVHIRQSKEQEEDRLNRIRRLVKFVKQMSQVTSVEELLTTVRTDLRTFHQVVAPILLLPLHGQERSVVFFSKAQILLRPLRVPARAGSDAGGGPDNEESIHGMLANILMRPIAKILPVEIDLAGRTATLFIEHTGNQRELKQLENHLLERRRPFAMSLDRLLLEMENNFSSYRWEKTFDNLKSPIAIIDREMSVLRSNRHFTSGERRGMCYRVFAGHEKRCDGCPIDQVLEKGQTQTGVVQVNQRSFEVHSYPIRLQEEGAITNIVNIYVDITPQRELQRRVLQNEKMSAIGLLAGNIAHELNNPLTGLRSLAQVLESQVPADSTMAQDLKEIEKASARSQTIIRNLLDFTTPGAQPLQATSVDAIVEKTLPLLKSMLRIHRLDLQLNAKQAVVMVEPNLIQQVVFNLINNACQAMKTAGQLTLRTLVIEGAAAQGKAVELQVADSGPGIPVEVQKRIFEPFFTTKTEGHGTGLGLSLSREIVEKFNGEISFISEGGKGTTFVVRLPVAGGSA